MSYVGAGLELRNVTRLNISNEQTHRPILPGGEQFEPLTVHQNGSVDDSRETGAEGAVRHMLPNAGRLEESTQPHCTTLAPGDQCSNLGHLVWESRQVDKTKHLRSPHLAIYLYRDLGASIVVYAPHDIVFTEIVTALDFNHHQSQCSSRQSSPRASTSYWL